MWLLLAACRPPAPVEPSPPPSTDSAEPLECPPFGVALGSGATSHVPLEDGDDATIVHGFQGINAFHVDVSGRISGGGGSVSVTATVTRLATGDVVVHAGLPTAEASFPLTPVDACTGDFWGFRAIFDTDFAWVTSPGICALDGERFAIALEVKDLADGELATDTAEVVVHPMPLDPDYDAWSWDCDNCPVDANSDQADTDEDGIGDACDVT